MRGFSSAIAVLGARVGGAALERRIDRAAIAARGSDEALVIACGGRAWNGRVEADAIADGLVTRGIDPERVTRDRLSLTTVENLLEARRLLRAAGGANVRVSVVTCAWHVERALRIGRKLGLDVVAAPAASPRVPRARRVQRAISERLAGVLDHFALAAHVEEAT
jgi:uncharacterized SAM-binding protein YcdF (DUF218 family)